MPECRTPAHEDLLLLQSHGASQVKRSTKLRRAPGPRARAGEGAELSVHRVRLRLAGGNHPRSYVIPFATFFSIFPKTRALLRPTRPKCQVWVQGGNLGKLRMWGWGGVGAGAHQPVPCWTGVGAWTCGGWSSARKGPGEEGCLSATHPTDGASTPNTWSQRAGSSRSFPSNSAI